MTALLPDGSYLSDLDGLTVGVIEAVICVRSDDTGYAQDKYRLVTTLLDPHRYPAEALIRLYHERWEIESAFYALRHTMLDGVVLRSHDRSGLEQEIWAMLTLYQLLRRAMVTAIDITVLAPAPDQMTCHAIRRTVRQAAARLRVPRPPTRRERATALMNAPRHEWTARELAERLQTTHHSMRTRFSEWTRLGLVTRIATGRYTPNTPTPPASSTRPRDHYMALLSSKACSLLQTIAPEQWCTNTCSSKLGW